VYDSGISGGTFSTPATSVSGVFLNAGYHVVDLPQQVSVVAGQQFSVVIRYQTPGYGLPVPLERPITGYAQPTAELGQSYLSLDGVSFADIHGMGGGWSNINACIKALAAYDPLSEGEGETPPSGVYIMGRQRVEIGEYLILRAILPDLEEPITIEWYKDDMLIDGASSMEYHISEIGFEHGGVYHLVATDASKAVYQSPPFLLRVFAEGSMPATGLLALSALTALLAWAGAKQRRARKR